MSKVLCQICTKTINLQKVFLCSQCKVAIKVEYNNLINESRVQRAIDMGLNSQSEESKFIMDNQAYIKTIKKYR